jgi:hypothetical protein
VSANQGFVAASITEFPIEVFSKALFSQVLPLDKKVQGHRFLLLIWCHSRCHDNESVEVQDEKANPVCLVAV